MQVAWIHLEFTVQRTFFTEGNDNGNFLERVIRYGNSHQEGVNSSQVSLFGEDSAIDMPEPKIPVCEAWSHLEQLKKREGCCWFLYFRPSAGYL